jgi:molybdate transport system substrate-binding protein
MRPGLLPLAFGFAGVNDEREGRMKILCTNGVKAVMVELIPAFERKMGEAVAVTWGSTVGLLKDIEAGATADIAVLTNEVIDDLIGRGKAIAGSRIDLARSAIGIAVRKDAAKPDIASAEALKRALLTAKSVAHSRTGLSGIYFPTVLERLGIVEAMKAKIVLPEAGAPVGDLVARGDAELGVQQISELLPVAGIDIVGPLPDPLQKITVFSAGVLAGAKDAKACKAFIDFAASGSRPLLAAKGLSAP